MVLKKKKVITQRSAEIEYKCGIPPQNNTFLNNIKASIQANK